MREKCVISEASVYQLLKAHDLVDSPAFIVMKAADEFMAQRAHDGLHDREIYRSPALFVRQTIGHQVAQDGQIGDGVELDYACSQFRDTGIFDLAVNQHGAFLANIGVEAAEANCEIRILRHPDAHQPVENGIPLFERNVEFLVAAAFSAAATPDAQARSFQRQARGIGKSHCGKPSKLEASLPLTSHTRWFRSYSLRVAGKSMRWCAPRLSRRWSALMASASAASRPLRNSNHSTRLPL